MYLKKLIIVLVITFAVCYATGIFFDYRYKKNFATLFFNSTDTLLDKSKNYDIILLGNSRVHFGMNPFYIDSVTGLSSYNFGIGGSDAAMLSLSTSLYLQNHPPPAFAVIGSDISFISANKAIQSQVHYLFYLSNDTIYNALKKYNPSLVLARYIPFLKYSFFDNYNRSFVFKEKKEFEKFEHNIYKGFINPHHAGSGSTGINYVVNDEVTVVSKTSIEVLKETISKLKKGGTKIIIISPPLKKGISEAKKRKFEDADAIFKSIASENGSWFLNMNDMPVYEDKYFTDDLHLNEPGTKTFSTQVGLVLDSIVKGIKKAP